MKLGFGKRERERGEDGGSDFWESRRVKVLDGEVGRQGDKEVGVGIFWGISKGRG